MRRLAVRARSALTRKGSSAYRFEHALQALALIVLAGSVIVVLAVTSTAGNAQTDPTGWLPLLQQQAVNAVSLTVLAAAAAVWYYLRYRQAKGMYLSRYQQRHDAGPINNGFDDPLTATIFGQLLDVRPPRSSLVATDDPEYGMRILDEVAKRIATGPRSRRGRLVPVLVDVATADAGTSVPAMARECFVQLFSDASADTSRAERLLRQEMRQHRVVVMLTGLDRVAEARSSYQRRLVTAALLRSCVEEDLPFVSSISLDLVTPMSDVAVIHGRPFSRNDQADHLLRRLRHRNVSVESVAPALEEITADVPPLSHWEIDLAADVIAMAIRAGDVPVTAVEAAFKQHDPGLRNLAWMADISGAPALPERAVDQQRPVTLTLAALGVLGHHRQELTVPESRLATQVGDALTLDAGLWMLARRRVVTVSDDDDRRVRFTRPEWFAYAGALGLGMNPNHWSRMLTPGVSQATLDALEMAVGLDRPGADSSVVALLERLRPVPVGDLTLEMLTSAVRGLSRSGRLGIGSRDVEALTRTWRVTSDQARLAFISAADPHPELAAFLWSRSLPADENSYRVRRAATQRLAVMAEPAWRRLGSTWEALLTHGGNIILDESSRSKDPDSDWVRVARPLATLGWTLPSLAARLAPPYREEALELLDRLRGLMGAGPDRVDVGLEISLAEGLKLAAATRPTDRAADPAVLTQGLQLFRAASSWSSKLVLVQALGLSGADRLQGDAREAYAEVEAVVGQGSAHPFVREAAALTLRGRARPGAASPVHGEYEAWVDDVQSLQDGGLELSDGAHRLLGLSTLLVNLTERLAKLENGTLTKERLHRRTTAFTSDALPPCFTRSSHTATMFEVACDCGLGLCGPEARGTLGDRRFSRAFAQRAEVTASTEALTPGRPFVTRAFSRVWRREEMVEDDPPTAV